MSRWFLLGQVVGWVICHTAWLNWLYLPQVDKCECIQRMSWRTRHFCWRLPQSMKRSWSTGPERRKGLHSTHVTMAFKVFIQTIKRKTHHYKNLLTLPGLARVKQRACQCFWGKARWDHWMIQSRNCWNQLCPPWAEQRDHFCFALASSHMAMSYSMGKWVIFLTKGSAEIPWAQ